MSDFIITVHFKHLQLLYFNYVSIKQFKPSYGPQSSQRGLAVVQQFEFSEYDKSQKDTEIIRILSQSDRSHWVITAIS